MAVMAAIAVSPNDATAAYKAPPVRLKAVDVYGTDALKADAVKHEFRHQFHQLVDAYLKHDMKGVAQITDEVIAKLKSHGDFAYLDLSVIPYPRPHRGFYVTVDAVDAKDKAARMPFRAQPTGTFGDPDGLFAAWGQYSQKLLKLSSFGRLKPFDPKDCPVLYCVASFDNAELEPYLQQFNTGAAKNADTLERIAIDSKDPAKRAEALFLLSHTNDAARVMPILTKAIYDPNEVVRNNAMLMMVSIANKGLDVDYPIKDLADALDFPTTRGRNKAVAVLDILAKSSKYKNAIKAAAAPTLLKLLRLEQPNNHDWAYQTLKDLSGKNYKDTDYKAWAKWAALQP